MLNSRTVTLLIAASVLFSSCGQAKKPTGASQNSSDANPTSPGSYPYQVVFTAPSIVEAGQLVEIGLKLSPPPSGSTKGVYYDVKAYDANGAEIWPYGFLRGGAWGNGDSYGSIAVTTTDSSSVGSVRFNAGTVYGKAIQYIGVKAQLITGGGLQNTVVANNSFPMEINAGQTPSAGFSSPISAIGSIADESAQIVRATGEIIRIADFNSDPFKYLGMMDEETFKVIYTQPANTGVSRIHFTGATAVSTGGGSLSSSVHAPNRLTFFGITFPEVTTPRVREVVLKTLDAKNLIGKLIAPQTYLPGFPEYPAGGPWIYVRGIKVPYHIEVPYESYPKPYDVVRDMR